MGKRVQQSTGNPGEEPLVEWTAAEGLAGRSLMSLDKTPSTTQGEAAAAVPATAQLHNAVWVEYLTAARAGDADALAALYDQTCAIVYGVVRRALASPEDAEEVTLDVYAYVWRASNSYDPARGSVLSWLVMLARSRCIDRVRSRQSRRRAEEAAAETASAVNECGYETQHVMRQALGELTPEQQRLMELAFYSGYSQSEIAKHLALPLGTVKTRIRAAITAMRAALERVGYREAS